LPSRSKRSRRLPTSVSSTNPFRVLRVFRSEHRLEANKVNAVNARTPYPVPPITPFAPIWPDVPLRSGVPAAVLIEFSIDKPIPPGQNSRGLSCRACRKTGTGTPLPVPFSADWVARRKRGQPASGSPPLSRLTRLRKEGITPIRISRRDKPACWLQPATIQ
jgi:hypothetical protein